MAQAPLPAADHCIGYNSTIVPWYVNYGPLFKELAGKRYNLQPHAVAVTAGTAVANAFVLNGTLIYPVALATTDSVTLELRGVEASVTAFEATYPGAAAGEWSQVGTATKVGTGRRRDCHSAAPLSLFSTCYNRDKKEVSSK